jgi:hypothetical protein
MAGPCCRGPGRAHGASFVARPPPEPGSSLKWSFVRKCANYGPQLPWWPMSWMRMRWNSNARTTELTSRFPTGFGSMPGTNIGRRCTLSRRLIPTCGTRCEALTPSSYRGEKTSFQRRRLWKMLRDACGISRKAIFPSRRPLRGQRNRSRSFQRKAQASQHREVSVKPDAFQAAHPERRKAVVIFQAPNSRSTAPRPR